MFGMKQFCKGFLTRDKIYRSWAMIHDKDLLGSAGSLINAIDLTEGSKFLDTFTDQFVWLNLFIPGSLHQDERTERIWFIFAENLMLEVYIDTKFSKNSMILDKNIEGLKNAYERAAQWLSKKLLPRWFWALKNFYSSMFGSKYCFVSFLLWSSINICDGCGTSNLWRQVLDVGDKSPARWHLINIKYRSPTSDDEDIKIFAIKIKEILWAHAPSCGGFSMSNSR